MRRFHPVLGVAALVAASWITAPAAPAADAPAKADAPPATAPSTVPAADGFVSVFNGKDLTGWVLTGDVKAGVEGGSLVIQDGNGLVRLEKLYGDFVLELEWKNRKAEKWDSGIFFRAEPTPAGDRWPAKYQVNLAAGTEGSLVGRLNGRAKGLAKGGEWNRIRLTVVGETAECEVNGKAAWKVEKITIPQGIVGIQVEVPGGGQFEFRNLRMKATTPPVDDPAAGKK